jgi:hypothetical protein
MLKNGMLALQKELRPSLAASPILRRIFILWSDRTPVSLG